MKRIAFICDLEEGHFLPTFALAHELERREHEIWYVSVVENQEIIEAQGFRFYCIFSNIYPKGTKELFKTKSLEQQAREADLRFQYHMEGVINEDGYGFLLREIKADIVLISCFLQFDVMILYYKYGIRPVLVGPILREPHESLNYYLDEYLKMMNDDLKYLILSFVSRLNTTFLSLRQLTAALCSLHEIIFCPGELDFNNPIKSPHVHYIGPSLRTADPCFNVYERYNIPAGKKIVYSSMGSQAVRHGRICDLFFGKVINIMREMEDSDLHLILCTGREYDQTQLGSIPDNVTLLGWGPQIDILPQTSVAIIHGGLGGIKECIYYGVPMIIFPQGWDQPKNAKRILFHGLGFEGDIETISENELKLLLLKTLQSDDIKFSISKMQKIFREKEQQQTGADLIEHLMKYESNYSY